MIVDEERMVLDDFVLQAAFLVSFSGFMLLVE